MVALMPVLPNASIAVQVFAKASFQRLQELNHGGIRLPKFCLQVRYALLQRVSACGSVAYLALLDQIPNQSHLVSPNQV